MSRQQPGIVASTGIHCSLLSVQSSKPLAVQRLARICQRSLVIAAVSAVLCGGASPSHVSADEPSADQANGQPTQAITPAQATSSDERSSGDAPLTFAAAQDFFGKYCLDCHSQSNSEGGLNLEQYADVSAARQALDKWYKVRQMLDFGAMPPRDVEQPDDSLRAQIVHWIDLEVLQLDCSRPTDPGRVTMRRLNRLEYNNTVRDLFGLQDYRPADAFPSDEVGGGFDNNADVLSLPPLLFEKYVSAAEATARRVIPAPDWKNVPSEDRKPYLFEFRGAVGNDGGRVLFSSDGEASVSLDVNAAGRYQIIVMAGAQQAGPEPARMAVDIDGHLLAELTIDAAENSLRDYVLPVSLPAGPRRISIRFTNDYWNPNDPSEGHRDRNLIVGGLKLRGPGPVEESVPEVARKFVETAYPSPGGTLADSVRAALPGLLTRTFRRPVTDEEVDRYVQLIWKTLEYGGNFEQGLQTVITGAMSSPSFLYRVEDDPSWAEQEPPYALNGYHLASRLSYFLWSTMPDDELMSAAGSGRLSDPAERERQVRRMLSDPKSESLIASFAHQWLNLRLLADASPDPAQYPQFTDAMRRDMLRETELFFQEIMREDRSILEFITGRFTYVNQRIAELYGMSGIEGEEFRRVSLDQLPRAGVVTHPGVLLLTSNPTRTSPVKRGKWVMENILGTPPPDPPPNVPPIEEAAKAAPQLSFRQQMELHRASPVCASCHEQMDAIGFAMENFDLLGRWRDKEGEHPIDASGEFPSGEKFTGPAELSQLLGTRSRMFASAMTRKMLAFALGRGLNYADTCVVEEIAAKLETSQYRFSALVLGIVESRPFLYRNAAGGE